MHATGSFPPFGSLAIELGQMGERLSALQVRMPVQQGPLACALLRQLACAAQHLEAARHALLGTAPSNAAPAEVGRTLTSGLEGSTRTVPLQDLFSFLATTGRTGVLRVETPSERFVVHFACGDVCYAFGDRVPPGEGLGDILLHEGVLTHDQLELLPARAAQEAWLAPALVESGWIARSDLAAALARQTRSAFLRLCHVDEARYAFAEGGAVEAIGNTRFRPVEMLLEAIRLSDESRWRGVDPEGEALPLGVPHAARPWPG